MPRAATLPLPATTGKNAAGENFPVASLLLAAPVRRQVMAFYRFARAADDLADHPALSADHKLAKLDEMERALAGEVPGCPEAQSLRQAVGDDAGLLFHAAQLLQAFRRDALVDHCRDWGDLMMYCRYSAAPVGRFLLDLHGEGAEAGAPADALCTALQVLNHLQDCGTDYQALGRVYIPLDWLHQYGLDRDCFAEPRSPAELRQVLDLVLNQVDGLLDLAHALPGRIADARLRRQAAVTVAVAERLADLLRRQDPLARRVQLAPLAYVGAVVAGLVRGR